MLQDYTDVIFVVFTCHCYDKEASMYMQIYITCHQIQTWVYFASEKYSDIEMPLRGLFENDIHKDKY